MKERRITPAPAGNTQYPTDSHQFSKDHPRACGKHSLLHSLEQKTVGSPPRLRETLCKILTLSQIHRITPAPAGNTDKKMMNTKST